MLSYLGHTVYGLAVGL